MKQEKIIVGSYLLRLTQEDVENRRRLEAAHPDMDYADILRDLQKRAVAQMDRPAGAEMVGGMEVEFRHFLAWINSTQVLGSDKAFTPAALRCWKTRRKTYTAKQIAEAFANLRNEPDRWQLNNNGFRPLSWWLEKDDRIEMMLNCHKKKRGGLTIIP